MTAEDPLPFSPVGFVDKVSIWILLINSLFLSLFIHSFVLSLCSWCFKEFLPSRWHLKPLYIIVEGAQKLGPLIVIDSNFDDNNGGVDNSDD